MVEEKRRYKKHKPFARVTHRMIYDSFRQVYPSFKKDVWYWYPYDEGSIVVYLKDGPMLLYSYFSRRAKFIGTWRKDSE